jgi:hypothetical protein
MKGIPSSVVSYPRHYREGYTRGGGAANTGLEAAVRVDERIYGSRLRKKGARSSEQQLSMLQRKSPHGRGLFLDYQFRYRPPPKLKVTLGPP